MSTRCLTCLNSIMLTHIPLKNCDYIAMSFQVVVGSQFLAHIQYFEYSFIGFLTHAAFRVIFVPNFRVSWHFVFKAWSWTAVIKASHTCYSAMHHFVTIPLSAYWLCSQWGPFVMTELYISFVVDIFHVYFEGAHSLLESALGWRPPYIFSVLYGSHVHYAI